MSLEDFYNLNDGKEDNKFRLERCRIITDNKRCYLHLMKFALNDDRRLKRHFKRLVSLKQTFNQTYFYIIIVWTFI